MLKGVLLIMVSLFGIYLIEHDENNKKVEA